MIFTVVWKNIAEDELAAIWVQHPAERNAITKGANQIDALLRIDPQSKGDPHWKGKRILHVSPLLIIFQTHETDLLVRVLAVWYIPPYTTNGFTESELP